MYRTHEDEDIIDILQQELTAMGVDVALAIGLESTHYLARLKQRNILAFQCMPAPTPEMIESLHNKHRFATFCHDLGIPHPQTFLLTHI